MNSQHPTERARSGREHGLCYTHISTRYSYQGRARQDSRPRGTRVSRRPHTGQQGVARRRKQRPILQHHEVALPSAILPRANEASTPGERGYRSRAEHRLLSISSRTALIPIGRPTHELHTCLTLPSGGKPGGGPEPTGSDEGDAVTAGENPGGLLDAGCCSSTAQGGQYRRSVAGNERNTRMRTYTYIGAHPVSSGHFVVPATHSVRTAHTKGRHKLPKEMLPTDYEYVACSVSNESFGEDPEDISI